MRCSQRGGPTSCGCLCLTWRTGITKRCCRRRQPRPPIRGVARGPHPLWYLASAVHGQAKLRPLPPPVPPQLVCQPNRPLVALHWLGPWILDNPVGRRELPGPSMRRNPSRQWIRRQPPRHPPKPYGPHHWLSAPGEGHPDAPRPGPAQHGPRGARRRGASLAAKNGYGAP